MSPEQFIELVESTSIGALDEEQRECLLTGTQTPAFIVAGPGSGKTRILVLRALRHTLVDRLLPETVVITTFTKKAANEIRSRLIGWGDLIFKRCQVQAQSVGDDELLDYLKQIDTNRYVTGTLDSICEEALSESRTPAEPRFNLIDEFAAKTLLQRKGELYQVAASVPTLDKFFTEFTVLGEPPSTLADKANIVKQIADRITHDLMGDKLGEIANLSPDHHAVIDVIIKYNAYLEERNLVDFAKLEEVVLDRLKQGRDLGLISQAQAILVDEYQDTNLLQEQIYFEIVRRDNAALTIVGDDDQSLYRFRGATIELFRDFAARASVQLGCSEVTPVYLKRNYRSSPEIVDFFNRFIANDPGFSPGARVQPLKPDITAHGDSESFPILGIFKEDSDELADSVSLFLNAVFNEGGYTLPDGQVLRSASPGGSFGDAVLLAKSVNEFKPPYRGQPAKERFPFKLRQRLEALEVRVFNPRGRPVHKVPAVQRLLGLVLECVDPSDEDNPQGVICGNNPIMMTNTKNVFAQWRSAAAELLADDPVALDGTSLTRRLKGIRRDCAEAESGPRDRPLLDVIYAFIPYLSVFEDDPEHQIYFETIARSASQMATFSPYKGQIICRGQHSRRSLEAVLRDMLGPLANGEVSVDEELISEVPRSSFSMMTIHQSKGLEFPLVLVDVSSEFTRNHAKTRFKRFPDKPSATTRLEDEFASHTEIGDLRTQRDALSRSFEDIIREYFVAFSRPECVLVLVGNSKSVSTKTTIKNIGQFWRQDGTWAWTDGYPAKNPRSLSNYPFVWIEV